MHAVEDPRAPVKRDAAALAEAREQLAAMSEILGAISTSPTDAQPVFETIVARASRLCGSLFANVFRFDGERLHFVASDKTGPDYVRLLREKYPMRPDRSQVSGRVVLTGGIVELEDALRDPDYDRRFPETLGWRSVLGVPMLRDGVVLGVIVVAWTQPGPVPPPLVQLLQTFAHQAAIAIGNVRLFDELQARNRALGEALEQQTATSEILHVISRSPTDVQQVFDAIVASATRLCESQFAFVLLREGDKLALAARTECTPEFAAFLAGGKAASRGSATGRAALQHAPAQILDFMADPEATVTPAHRAEGVRTVLAVPMLRDDELLGVIATWRREVRPFTDKQVRLLETFAAQAVIAIQNARLFREIEDKSRQLEAASRHKSAFLANMSHELRTPLNAIIGFTRIVMRRCAGQIDARQAENLEKILASAQHLLSLINAVLDLAKVEAGRIELHPGMVDPAPMLEQCLRIVEPLVKDAVSLARKFDGALPAIVVDEEKLRQIVTNLLSNAAKFTEGGCIELRAHVAGGVLQVAVADTGIGIAADKHDAIFEEFEQADSSSTRQYGGTGLGLAISRRLARLMGGDIRVASAPGAGSTFTLTLPVAVP